LFSGLSMFFVKKLRREILMEPQFLGSKLREHVKHRVMQELEGQCLGKHGYVISVLDVKDEDIAPGLVDNDTGAVSIMVWYSVILLRPFRNQVLDTIVTLASDENGFFTKVGPLMIFVSRHNMPEDIAFNPVAGDCWVSEDEKVEIREGSLVRVRIIGLNFDAGSMSAIGTIKETYLGQLEI
jgi:DNA-directed RNA polymerase II subunit RPB7